MPVSKTTESPVSAITSPLFAETTVAVTVSSGPEVTGFANASKILKDGAGLNTMSLRAVVGAAPSKTTWLAGACSIVKVSLSRGSSGAAEENLS